MATDRLCLSLVPFAQRMLLVQLVAVAVGAGCLWVFYWRRGQRKLDSYQPPPPVVPMDRLLFRVATAVAVLFVLAMLAGVSPAIVAATSLLIIVPAFAARQRSALTLRLVPIRLLLLVIGLGLVVDTVDRLGSGDLLRHLIGHGDTRIDIARTAATGAVLGNTTNNVPAYLVGEAAVPVGNHTELLALLIGTNLGSLITPWGSLATLIWFERVRATGLLVPMRRFVVTSAITATLTVTAATATLLAVR